MSAINKVPKIRFRGYSENWVEYSINQITNRIDNLRVPIKESDRIPGDTPYYGANGIQGYVSGYTHDGEFVLIAEDGASDLEYYPVQYVNKKIWVNNHAHVLQAKSKNINSKFLKYALNQMKIKPYLVGGGRAKLNADILMNLSLALPCITEQEMIAKSLSSLDRLISNYKEKYSKFYHLKQTMLEKMFPMVGKNQPEIRFEEFENDWTNETLASIAIINPESSLPSSFEYVDLESVKGTELLSHTTIQKINAPSRAQRVAVTGDIFYQTVRPYQKNNYLYDLPYENYVFSTGYAQIRSILNPHYLLAFLQNDVFVKSVLNECTGTSYPAINSSNLANMIISYPTSTSEQIKIGAYFKNMDQEIKSIHVKIQKLQSLKKSLMERLFV